MPIQSLSEDEIQALLAAERERCAKVADNFNSDCSWLNEEAICERVAAVIRNLPPQTEESQT